jgi:hypothetical protein
MKTKTLLAVVAVCTLGLLVSIVVGQDQQSLPPGVLAQYWIPIGDEFGFAVTPASAIGNPEFVAGYFFARYGNSWKRVHTEGVLQLQPLHK